MNRASAEAKMRRWLARAGARVALAQAVVVILSFTLAGIVTQLVTDHLQNAASQERVLGELRSLEDEVLQKGVEHLPHTIEKRTHLWRGFAYRLVSAGGSSLAGELAQTSGVGWRRQPGTPFADRHDARPFLVLTKRLPGGHTLSVGQDQSAQLRAEGALAQTLLVCGALGVMICIAASHAFSRHAWRRVAAIADVARDVGAGRLELRVKPPASPPRDDLDDLAVSFNEMLDRMEVLLGQVRQVSVDIAHDLRTPLTRVRQRLERLLPSASGNPQVVEGLRLIDADLSELLRVFDALLQLTEINAPPQGRPHNSFDLAQVVTNVAEAFRPDIEDGGRSLRLKTIPTPTIGDERLMAQLVANLIENAIRHTPTGTCIDVEVSETPALVVQDDGPGIPRSQHEAVMRPLVRLEKSRFLPGFGLGLSIVGAIAARHDGTLILEDAKPGLRVRLTLPQASHCAHAEYAVNSGDSSISRAPAEVT